MIPAATKYNGDDALLGAAWSAGGIHLPNFGSWLATSRFLFQARLRANNSNLANQQLDTLLSACKCWTLTRARLASALILAHTQGGE
jgi:hypothetical protein